MPAGALSGGETAGDRGAPGRPVGGGLIADLKDLLRRNLALYSALREVKIIGEGLIGMARGRVAERWRGYLPDPGPEWEEAWKVTEHALAELKREVEADGARLAVTAIAENFVLDPDWRNALRFGGGTAVPEGFDIHRPGRRLAEIARSLDLPHLDLAEDFAAYRDAWKLPGPYFSFACDGHWNPLAHYLAAHRLAVFLAEKGLLPAGSEDQAVLRERSRAAFARPPREILGTDAYRQIYGGGVYTGGGPTD